MPKYAVLKGDRVIELVDADEPPARPDAYTVQSVTGSPRLGDRYDTAAEAVKPPAVNMPALRAKMLRGIDGRAERARQAFITPGSGQAMSYRQKLMEADDALANHDGANPPPAGKYPILESEVPSRAADVLAVATIVRATADSWIATEAAINRTRVEAKAAVATAASREDLTAILAGLIWPQPS